MAIHSSANFSVFTILSVPHHPNIREIITSTTIFFFSLSLFSPGQDFFFYEIKKTSGKKKQSFYLFLIGMVFRYAPFLYPYGDKVCDLHLYRSRTGSRSCRPCRTGCDKRKENPGTACDNSVPPFCLLRCSQVHSFSRIPNGGRSTL